VGDGGVRNKSRRLLHRRKNHTERGEGEIRCMDDPKNIKRRGENERKKNGKVLNCNLKDAP